MNRAGWVEAECDSVALCPRSLAKFGELGPVAAVLSGNARTDEHRSQPRPSFSPAASETRHRGGLTQNKNGIRATFSNLRLSVVFSRVLLPDGAAKGRSSVHHSPALPHHIPIPLQINQRKAYIPLPVGGRFSEVRFITVGQYVTSMALRSAVGPRLCALEVPVSSDL